jgi:hypothetical protein
MSVSQDSSQQFHEYDSDDRQLLVGLLHEYSDKLIEASREVARKRGENNAGGIIIFLPACFFSLAFSYLFWQVFVNYAFTNLYITISHKSEDLLITILSGAIILFPILQGLLVKTSLSDLFPNFYFGNHYRSIKIEKDLLERDARMIANRLESAMRLTVEVADRVETNLARKLELDLRIDDASSALDYYYSVVNLKSKSQSKSRKVAP